MSRHERDALSLTAGLLLLVPALLFLLADLTTVDVDGRWVLPAGLVLVGLAGLLAGTRSRTPEAPPS